MKRNRLNALRADKLVFIHSNIRLQSRFGKEYKEGPYKKWDVDPENTYVDDSIVRLEEMRWRSLEGDFDDIPGDTTGEDNVIDLSSHASASTPFSSSTPVPHTACSNPAVRRVGLHQTSISSFAKGKSEGKRATKHK